MANTWPTLIINIGRWTVDEGQRLLLLLLIATPIVFTASWGGRFILTGLMYWMFGEMGFAPLVVCVLWYVVQGTGRSMDAARQNAAVKRQAREQRRREERERRMRPKALPQTPVPKPVDLPQPTLQQKLDQARRDYLALKAHAEQEEDEDLRVTMNAEADMEYRKWLKRIMQNAGKL
jgi:hypothetical protein